MKRNNLFFNTSLLSLFILLKTFAIAQPTDPCHNSNREVISSCSQVWSITLSGAGDYNSSMCGFSTPGNEIVFAYTPVVSGIHSIDLQSTTGGVFLDFAWKLASGGCSATGWTCIDDVSIAGTFGAMNWTAGLTYYIIIDAESTTAVTFDFKLNCPNVATEPSECANAVSICSNASFSVDPNGYGLIDEIPTSSSTSISNPSNPSAAISGTDTGGFANAGCLLSGETNSTWMIINVLTAGLLEFSFGNYQASGNFFDWAMWPYSPTACASITGNTLAPLRCNYNGSALSFTGIASPANITALQGTYSNSITNNFAPALSVASNTQYVICFSNWSDAQTNVPLNFFGTAGISCLPLGDFDIDVFGSKLDHMNKIQWNVSNEYAVLNYAVERRSEDGQWMVLGTKDVNANGGSLSYYEYIDESPIRGDNYYRIVQYLLNGSKKESAIIAIEQKIEGLSILSTFPNPANDLLNVEYSTINEGDVELQIVNIIGTVVYSENMSSSAGVSINSIDVSQFGSGTFLIQLIDKVTGEKRVARFVKE